MNFEKIHRMDKLTPQLPGKYLVRIGWIRGPWLPVYFDGSQWTFISGDVFNPRIIILWRIMYEGYQ